VTKRRKRDGSLAARLESACLVHGVDYDVGNGKSIAIPLIPVPMGLTETYLRYTHTLSEAINRHLKKMPGAWFRDEAVAEALPFPDLERRFIESVWKPEHASRQTVVSRNDFDMPADPRDCVAFESNGCAIGGIWYGAASARVGRQVLIRDLRDRGGAMIEDGYDVFLEHLHAHAKREGLPKRFRVGLLEDRSWDAGITEMPSLLRRLTVDGWSRASADRRSRRCARRSART
jgi:hypothetical protein